MPGKVIAEWGNSGTRYRMVRKLTRSALLHDNFALEMREYDAAGGDRWVELPIASRGLEVHALLSGVVALAERTEAVAETMTYAKPKTVTINRAGGYDPNLPRDHPDNFDPTLEPAAGVVTDK